MTTAPMTAARVLVIEDEPGLQRTLADRLRAEGFDATIMSDAQGGAAQWRKGTHDVVLLDMMLPGVDGLTLLRAMRREGLETPVLMLTARDGLDDKVQALGFGADDYLTKPFEPRELIARLKALLRRHRGTTALTGAGSIDVGPWVIDLNAATVVGPDGALELSSTEWLLLAYLAQNGNRVISRDELLKEVWGYAPDTVSRTVDQHIAQLRHKLDPDRMRPRNLETVHGRGYVLRTERAAD